MTEIICIQCLFNHFLNKELQTKQPKMIQTFQYKLHRAIVLRTIGPTRSNSEKIIVHVRTL